VINSKSSTTKLQVDSLKETYQLSKQMITFISARQMMLNAFP